MQSAGLRVVKGDLSADPLYPDWQALYDLRVDEHDEPVAELTRLARLRRAQIIDAEGHELLEQDQREAPGLEGGGTRRLFCPLWLS